MTIATVLQFPIDRTHPTEREHKRETHEPQSDIEHPSRNVIPLHPERKGAAKRTLPSRQSSQIKMNIRLYQAFHPLPPKGIRSWGFAIGNFTESFWVHGLPYALAEKKAIAEAKRVGAMTVILLP